MGAIADVFKKELKDITIDDIHSLIDNRVEENHRLEYKGKEFLEPGHNLSAWVSAFLNAEGGLIILGVSEVNPADKEKLKAKIFPKEIQFIDMKHTKESIEQSIFDNIRCTIRPDIRIVPIRNPKETTEAIYLIEIPQGDNPPYQAADRIYYRRLNSTKYPLSHYEIADFFGRRRKPKLSLKCVVTNPYSNDSNTSEIVREKQTYQLRIFISNDGTAAAKYAQAWLSFENVDIISVLSGPNNRIDSLRDNKPTLQWDKSVGVIYSAPINVAIWNLEVKLHKDKWGLLTWGVYAEDTDITTGDWVVGGTELTPKQGETARPYYLQTYEELFKHPRK